MGTLCLRKEHGTGFTRENHQRGRGLSPDGGEPGTFKKGSELWIQGKIHIKVRWGKDHLQKSSIESRTS